MSFHDAYARITPFELAFPGESFAEEHLDRIRAAAGDDDASAALADPERFVSIPAVAETLFEFRDTRRPEEVGTSEGGDAVQKHALLLYHAFHFREAGSPLYLLDVPAARHLVETSDGWGAQAPPAPPVLAGYLQLPRHLFWIGSLEEGAPEPVDGVFWSAPRGERIAVLVVAGIRRERPGFSVLPLPAVPLVDSADWLDAEVREGGGDFESTLPGGEMERLYSVRTAGEVLKLLARTFRYLERTPGAVEPEEGPDAAPAAEHGLRGGAARGGPLTGTGSTPSPAERARAVLPPRPTVLPYRRIRLRGNDERGP